MENEATKRAAGAMPSIGDVKRKRLGKDKKVE